MILFSDALIFVGLILVVLFSYMVWKLRGINWIEYFKTKDGKGILKGIILAPIAIIVIALALSLLPAKAQASGTWFNDASVFIGIDSTKKVSPQCIPDAVDNRGTSNLGARLNIWQSDSKNIRLNSKYTHHSCVLGKDDRSYDAVGIELEWRVWQRSR
jgi:hypothetical protein